MYTVNIDAGGTMTDGLVIGDGRVWLFKVDSTPHDLTVSLLQLLKDAAQAMGFADRRSFLDRVSFIRWSSTVTSNVLAERRGPRIGLLVDKGHEKKLYGKFDSPIVDNIIPGNSIIGLKNRSDDPAEALAAVRTLLESGVRRICISFAGAFACAQRETRLKRHIVSLYPDHYLGAVPVLLGSNMIQSSDDMTRTHYVIINAYVHPALAASLFKAEDMLKIEDGWRGTLLVGHTNGGMARVGKTRAIDTIESGPVFGTHAAAWFAKHYQLPGLFCVDLGGTTAKVSIVRDGEPVTQKGGDFFGIPVSTSLQMLRSLALGGGSVVHCSDDRIKIGPRSMGAAPGPACYGLGGTEATLTDCLLVLGYLDAENFLGGRRQLNVETARAAIANKIAGPLGLTVAAAALATCDQAGTDLAALIRSTATEAGMDPSVTPVFAYGGNGPLLVALAADKLELSRIYVSFTLGPVFSAFGTAISNVAHLYEQGIVADGDSNTQTGKIRAALELLFRRARRDLRSEGFELSEATFCAELEINDSTAATIPLPPPEAELPALPDCRQAVVRVRVECPVPGFSPQLAQLKSEGTAARLGRCTVCLHDQPEQVPVYDAAALGTTDRIAGPALVRGGSLTCLVPRKWQLVVDGFGNGVITREG